MPTRGQSGKRMGMAPKSPAMCWIVMGLAAAYCALLYLVIFKLRRRKS